MHNFYNNLYEISKVKPILIHIDKKNNDEDDVSIIFRLDDYGVIYKLVDEITPEFKKFEIETSISKGYKNKI